MKTFVMLLVLLSSLAMAQDKEAAALRHLSGKPIAMRAPRQTNEVCFEARSGVRDGILGWTGTLSQVRAYMLTPEFAAYWPTSPEYAQWQAAQEAAQIPDPDVTVPILKANGTTGGVARLLVNEMMEIVPVRRKSWTTEKGAFQAQTTTNDAIRLEVKDIVRKTKTTDVEIAAISGTSAQQITALKRELADVNQQLLRLERQVRKMLKDGSAE